MEMIKIPHTDLEVSRLAMECMGLGNRHSVEMRDSLWRRSARITATL
jgi:hypothetical protein